MSIVDQMYDLLTTRGLVEAGKKLNTKAHRGKRSVVDSDEESSFSYILTPAVMKTSYEQSSAGLTAYKEVKRLGKNDDDVWTVRSNTHPDKVLAIVTNDGGAWEMRKVQGKVVKGYGAEARTVGKVLAKWRKHG